jgi:hypothetical protein
MRVMQILQQPGMDGVVQTLMGGGWTGGNDGGAAQTMLPIQSGQAPLANGMDAGLTGVGAAYGGHAIVDAFNGGPSGLLDVDITGNGADAAGRTLEHPGDSSSSSTRRKRRKRNTAQTQTQDGTGSSPVGAAATLPDLPAWPMPPRGKGSRLAMSRDEILDRRKARNKQSALDSRARKAVRVETLEEELAGKQRAMEEVKKRCQELEKE